MGCLEVWPFLNVLPGVSFDLCLVTRGSPGKKGGVIFRWVCLLALKVDFYLATKPSAVTQETVIEIGSFS